MRHRRAERRVAFFTPGSEILLARSTAEAVSILAASREALAAVGRAARARALRDHTGLHRARELVDHLSDAARGR